MLHDAANGAGGFVSLIYNKSPKDQLRLFGQLRTDYFQIPYDPDPNSIGNSQIDSSGLRDTQRENDGTVAFTWLHTLNASSVVQVSPFIHVNTARYHSIPTEQPIATTDDRTSRYGGTQFTGTTQIARNTLQAGLYFFEQFDNYRFGAVFNDGSGTAPIDEADAINGSVDEEYLSDTFKATPWLTLNAGIRFSRFYGQVEEQVTAPRFGAALRIPKLHWVFAATTAASISRRRCLRRLDRFSRTPPATILRWFRCAANATKSISLGVQIPLHGWLVDIDNSKEPRQQLSGPLEHRRIEHLFSGHGRWCSGPRMGDIGSFATQLALRAGASSLLQPDCRTTRRDYWWPDLHADRLATVRYWLQLFACGPRPAQHAQRRLQRLHYRIRHTHRRTCTSALDSRMAAMIRPVHQRILSILTNTCLPTLRLILPSERTLAKT